MPTPRIFGLALLALALASPAYAGTVCTDLVPPARYRDTPVPEYTLVPVANIYRLYARCEKEVYLGCAYRDTMTVYYLASLRDDPVRFRCFKRHEEAHLNGWPADHPE